MKVGERFKPQGMFTGLFIPSAVARNSELKPISKIIYGRLCQFAGSRGVAFPSLETLGNETGLNVSTVRKALLQLEGLKFIEIRRPLGKDKLDHKTCRYYFLWKEGFENSLKKVAQEENDGDGEVSHSGD